MRAIPEPDPDTTPRLVARLRELSTHDWQALAARLDSLRGDQITSIWRRAERRAQWMAPLFRNPGGATQTLFAVGELLGEFKSPHSRIEARERHHAFVNRMAAGPRRAHLVAASELHDLVAAACPGDRVLLEMVLLSAQLVAYRASVADVVVRESYEFLEPILPFADLTAA